MAAADLAPQTAQGARQASIRAITGTAHSYEGDWHALFDRSSITAGPYEGRLLTWINQQVGRSFTSLPEAQQAYATLNGVFNWSSLGSIWTPQALGASLLGFWDAERADLITRPGGAVSSWKDAVAGYDLAQAVGGAQPSYNATGFNSRPVVTFDGVDDFLNLESVPFPTGANAAEIWVLGDQTALAADTGDRTAFTYGGAGATTRVANYRRVVSGANRAAGAVGNGVTGIFPTNASIDFSGLHVARLVSDGANTRIDADGVAGGALAVVPSVAATRTRMGSSTTLTPGNFWQGGISAVLVTGPLSAAQSTALLGYLKQRGGIT